MGRRVATKRLVWKKNPINVRCRVCSSITETQPQIVAPFVVGNSTLFSKWLNANKFTTLGLCSECKDDQSEDDKIQEALAKSKLPSIVEHESRLSKTVSGFLKPTRETYIEYMCGDFRIRKGVAVKKEQVLSRPIFDIFGGFNKRVSSLETWPITSYNLLLYSKDQVDFHDPRIMTRTCCQGVETTMRWDPMRIGYKLVHEQEYNSLPSETSLGSFGFIDLDVVICGTRILTYEAIGKMKPMFYSPKIDGHRMLARFSPNGLYLENISTHELDLLQLQLPDDLTNFKYNLLVEIVGELKVIIDVAVNVWSCERAKLLIFMQAKWGLDLLEHGILFQQFSTTCPREFQPNVSIESFSLPIDGYIITPTQGVLQYKIKQHNTVDLFINLATKTISSKECIIALFSNIDGCETSGVYECLLKRDSIELIRKREDKEHGNDVAEIVENCINDVSLIDLYEQYLGTRLSLETSWVICQTCLARCLARIYQRV